MMTNRNRVVLYTGVTNDLRRRVWEHQNGAVRGFAKKYKLHILAYHESYHDIRDAIAREKEIKGWLRSKKNVLVETAKPEVGGSVANIVRANERSFATLRMTSQKRTVHR